MPSYQYLQKTSVVHQRSVKRPSKKKTQKLQENPQNSGMEDPPLSLSKPKKKKCFFKELVGRDLEQVAVEVFLRERNLSPKRTQLVTLKKQETRVSPRKRGHFLPRRSSSAVDQKRILGPRAAASRKRENSKSFPGKIRTTSILWGMTTHSYIS